MTPEGDRAMGNRARGLERHGTRTVVFVLVVGLNTLGLSACGDEARAENPSSAAGQVDLPRFMLDAQDMSAAGLAVSDIGSRTISADDVYEQKGTLGDIQRSNFTQGR